MADPHSHDERQKYEDELYKDDSEVDNEGASDSENGGDEEALSHINYSHSFRLENEGDEEAEEEEASVSGDIIPPDLLSHVPSWTETEVVMISEENMEGPGVSSISSKKRREKKSPEDVDLEVKVMRMRSPSADDNPNLDEGSLEGFSKETNCYLCKADHDPLRCPMSKLCFKCMQRGHIYAECPNARDNTRCGFCNDGNGHHPMQCPQQWRQFVFLPYSGDKERDQLTIYCYNCGDGGHMGDFYTIRMALNNDFPIQECRHRPIHGSTGISSFTALAFNHKFPDRRRGVTYTPARRESPSGGGPIEIYSDNEDNEPMPVPGASAVEGVEETSPKAFSVTFASAAGSIKGAGCVGGKAKEGSRVVT
ncbi:uncharacterized protein EV422DRAFT_508936 [Fimicolochytrium jonesii]|uniref:uncharacterized protein n=1 Tax=Fimicolochytrium jonesii TaxID=1396493 RepID=UPI0022FF048E|nr:uncharacterized protein EV422DRAFT_508936 [Fimicolochytrium jonesii]KAI8817333.1 hypothetical protein EV422DRAFT_508936 [Fimicolochytrium jonesii]